MRKSGVIALLPLLFSCAPKQTALHRAAVTSLDTAMAIEAFQDAEQVLFTDGWIGPEEHQTILGLTTDVARAGVELNQAIRLGQEGRVTVIVALDHMVISVDKLARQGVLKIKNENARIHLQTILTSLRAILAAVSVGAR